MRYTRFILALFFLLILSPGLMAQMPAPPGGFVHVNPPFEGVELIYTSTTIEAHNWYGNYRLDVLPGTVTPVSNDLLDGVIHTDTVASAMTRGDLIIGTVAGWDDLAIGLAGTYLSSNGTDVSWIAFPPGASLWETDTSYRGGAASLEPVTAQDGVALLVQDGTATFYSVLLHNGTDNIHDSNLGHHSFFSTGVGSALRIYAPGQIPGGGSTHWVQGRHNDIDGFLETGFGALVLRPGVAGLVGIGDRSGGADDYYFPDGDGLAGQALTTDGLNTLSWTTMTNALLDASNHTDTTASAVTRGDLIIGNSTPDWDDLPIGLAGTILGSNGTDPSWIAHAAPVHAFLDSTVHTGTVTQAPTRGSIIVGDATPNWNETVVGTAGQAVGTMDGTDTGFTIAPRTAFQLAEVALSIDDTVTAVAPLWLDIDGLDTGTNFGHNMTRAGHITGIAINNNLISEFPATTDQVNLDVYKNGTAIGLTVTLDPGTLEGQATQAPGLDTFIAGDNLTIGAYYKSNGGAAATFTLDTCIAWVEVVFD